MTHDSLLPLRKTAQQYLDGNADFMSFWNTIAETCRSHHRDSSEWEFAIEWFRLAERCRNAFGIANKPISEDEFKEWLRTALSDSITSLPVTEKNDPTS